MGTIMNTPGKRRTDKQRDGRELLKNVRTLEEYDDLTTSTGHDPDEPLDYKDIEQPQDKDKRFRKKHDEDE